jgi:hypothetical protein
MKTLLAGLVALTTTAFAQVPNDPAPPALKDVLRRANPQVLVFSPVTMGREQSLNFTHIRMGDGSVKPGAAVQLIVYAADGDNEVLFQDFHFLSKEGSPVLQFDSFSLPVGAVGESKGIIAVLIGLLLPANNVPARPFNLPLNDIVSAEITDGTSNTLLLPAVQKVRSAAAR